MFHYQTFCNSLSISLISPPPTLKNKKLYKKQKNQNSNSISNSCSALTSKQSPSESLFSCSLFIPYKLVSLQHQQFSVLSENIKKKKLKAQQQIIAKTHENSLTDTATCAHTHIRSHKHIN